MKTKFILLITALILASAVASVSATSEMSAKSDNTENSLRVSENTEYTLSFEIGEKEYYTEESIAFEGETNIPCDSSTEVRATSSDGVVFYPTKETVTIYLKDADDEKNTIKGYANFNLEPGTYSLVIKDPETGAGNSAFFRIIESNQGSVNEGGVKTGNSLSIDANQKEYYPEESISFVATTNLPADTSFNVEITDSKNISYELSKLYMTDPYVSMAGDEYYTIKGYADAPLPYPASYKITITDEDTGVSASDAFRVVGFETGNGNGSQTGEQEYHPYQIRIKTDLTCTQTGVHKPGEELTVSGLTTFDPETVLDIRIYDADTHTVVFTDETTVTDGDDDPQWNNVVPVQVKTEEWSEGGYILEAEGAGGITDTFTFKLDEQAYNTYEYQNQNENQNGNETEEEDEGPVSGFFRYFFRFFGSE